MGSGSFTGHMLSFRIAACMAVGCAFALASEAAKSVPELNYWLMKLSEPIQLTQLASYFTS